MNNVLRLAERSPGRQSDKAFERLHRAIIRCELMPGVVVPEAELARRFGLGRAAARAAADRLSMLNLLKPIRRTGYEIKPISLRDVNDLFQARLILETACVRLAAGKVNAADLRRLDGLCDVRYSTNDADSIERFLQANSEFHLFIASTVGNERLIPILAGIFAEMERLFHFGLKVRNRTDEIRHEHQALIEALVTGNADAAERETRDQIEASRAMVLDALISSSGLLDVRIGVEKGRSR
ncbi:MAG: GntR family transcriptional regulator [Parvibaculaceae bacterium]